MSVVTLSLELNVEVLESSLSNNVCKDHAFVGLPAHLSAKLKYEDLLSRPKVPMRWQHSICDVAASLTY